MIVSELPADELQRRLCTDGLRIAAGPFNYRLRSEITGIAPEFARLYAHHEIVADEDFVDFHVRIERGRGLRRWIKPQARFVVDGIEPFTPLPQAQALPMIEWGLNWCITAYSQHLLVIHAASVARGERAVIMPAPPGSGKSTLCAALVNRGWRLLSDELTVIRLETSAIEGLARPVNLKGASIDIIRNYAPQAFVTAPVADTTKGTVALMAPPEESVRSQLARPCWMVLPRYRAGAPLSLAPLPSGAAFLRIADNAMNYHVLGVKGFEAVGRLVDDCRHYELEYSALDEAVAQFDRLADEQ